MNTVTVVPETWQRLTRVVSRIRRGEQNGGLVERFPACPGMKKLHGYLRVTHQALFVLLSCLGVSSTAAAQAPVWSDSGVMQHNVRYSLKLYANSGQWRLDAVGTSASGSCSIPFSFTVSRSGTWNVPERICGAARVKSRYTISNLRRSDETISFKLSVSGSAHLNDSTGIVDLFGSATGADTSLGNANRSWTISATDQAAVARRQSEERQRQAAEQRRIEEQQRIAAEQRRQEEQRREEQRRLAEQQRIAAEQRRLDELRRLEEQRLQAARLEDQRRAEEQRRLAAEQERRRLEEQRRTARADIAAISPSGARSMNSEVATAAAFVNRTGGPVQVNWVNFTGEEVVYAQELAAGTTYRIDTYATHVWRFRQRGRLVAEHVVAADGNPVYEIAASQSPAPSRVSYTPRVGGGADVPFDDQCGDPARIIVRSGWWVDGVQLVCTSADGGAAPMPLRGGGGGQQFTFALQPGERLTGISGTTHGPAGAYVYSIRFHTDQRVSPLFGNGGANPGQQGRQAFRIDIPEGRRFAGFHGASGQYLSAIGLAYR